MGKNDIDPSRSILFLFILLLFYFYFLLLFLLITPLEWSTLQRYTTICLAFDCCTGFIHWTPMIFAFLSRTFRSSLKGSLPVVTLSWSSDQRMTLGVMSCILLRWGPSPRPQQCIPPFWTNVNLLLKRQTFCRHGYKTTHLTYTISFSQRLPPSYRTVFFWLPVTGLVLHFR